MAKGSIEKRGTNSWRLTIELGEDAFGERQRERKKVVIDDPEILKSKKLTREYLEDALHNFRQEVLTGQYVKPAGITFQSFVEKEWKPKYADDEENLSPKTLLNYEGHLNKHIFPVIGHMRLDEIKTITLVNLFDVIKKPGGRKDGRGELLASGTVIYIQRAVKNVFERAVEWKFIKENPMNGVPRPKKTPIQAEKYYEEDETQAVIDALYKHAPTKWRLYCMGAIIGGYRRGELTALEWPDALFEKNAIRIDESIPLTRKGKAVVRKPKTAGSKDIVSMPEWYMAELQAYRPIWEKEKADAGDKWQGGEREYIFHGGFGKPYFYTYPYEWWTRFLKRHGLKHLPFHGLRHTMATILLEEETDTKVIQERLRHTLHSTTTGIYAHVTKKLSRVAASKFDRFNPRKQPEERESNSVPNPSPTEENTESPAVVH